MVVTGLAVSSMNSAGSPPASAGRRTSSTSASLPLPLPLPASPGSAEVAFAPLPARLPLGDSSAASAVSRRQPSNNTVVPRARKMPAANMPRLGWRKPAGAQAQSTTPRWSRPGAICEATKRSQIRRYRRASSPSPASASVATAVGRMASCASWAFAAARAAAGACAGGYSGGNAEAMRARASRTASGVTAVESVRM